MSMFDMRNIKKPNFEITLVNGKQLSLNPVKMSVLRRLTKIQKKLTSEESQNDEAEILDELNEVIVKILGSNKSKETVTEQDINDWDMNDLQYFISEYFEWVRIVSDQKK